MSTKRTFLLLYVVLLHLVVLALIGMLALAVSMIREERRLPGSRLYATYENNDDGWWHHIQHDGRDPVLSIQDRFFGVDLIVVAPPDSSFVWMWTRDEGEEWELTVSDYSSVNAADHHIDTSLIQRLILDVPIDGYPDREVEIHNGVRTGYNLSMPDREMTGSKPIDIEP
ncbi:MAG: hypothetical protein ACX94C_13615 [Phycisphaerales bacterium]